MHLSIGSIKEAVCTEFGASDDIFIEKDDHPHKNYLRNIVMYLASEKGGFSHDTIGLYMGSRDQDTVESGINTLKRLIKKNHSVRERVAKIRDKAIEIELQSRQVSAPKQELA